MVHSLNNSVNGGNVMLKIDMAKAYDRVDWRCLREVLEGFGFSTKFCNLVAECISSPWFSIMMNGLKGFLNRPGA